MSLVLWFVLAVQVLGEGYTQDPKKGSILERHRRFRVDNATGPHAFRPGFRYPRQDGRMQDGDEVQIYSGPHKTWLAVAEAPAHHSRGKVTLRGGRDHKFCEAQGDKLVCARSSSAQVELKDAGWGGRVGLIVNGKLCSDTPHGLQCNRHVPDGHIAGWEAMQIEEVGEGIVAFKGGRAGKYCADDHGGVICNRDWKHAHETFQLEPVGGGGNTAIIQTKDAAKAATFVVDRGDPDGRELTLQCKGTNRYLHVERETRTLGCTSYSPSVLRYHRIEGSIWWASDRGSFQDPNTGKYLRADHPDHGGRVKADGNDKSGWQLFHMKLVAGYEDVYPLVRGVNLGSWFLLEKWMVPGLFRDKNGNKFGDKCADQDEYGLMKHLDDATKRSRMEQHWGSFITEDDIEWLAGHGINTVRVPFGYWMTHPEAPFIDGQLKYMEKLFNWCEKHKIAVILDFHGLKGSQNGAFTSGNCGGCGTASCGATWVRFLDHQHTNLAVIDKMMSRFGKSAALLGFGVANEVKGDNDMSHDTMAFYEEAYKTIRKHSASAWVILDATFNPSGYPFQGEVRIAQDDHMYYSSKFKEGASNDNLYNLKKARGRQLDVVRWQTLIGEWALDHHGNSWGKTNDEWLRGFAKAQLQSYEQHSMGWVYWSYKTEYHASTWNFRHLCERGMLPGCHSNYAPDNWFEHHPCSYAYLHPTHMDSDCQGRVISV